MEKTAMMLALVHFSTMLVPGPTAFFVLRSATGGRWWGNGAIVLGISSASLANVSLVISGLTALIVRNPYMWKFIQIWSAGYLFYLGFTALRNEKAFVARRDLVVNGHRPNSRRLFIDGFLINFLNPGTIAFYLGVFAQLLRPDMPAALGGVLAGQIVLQSFLFWATFTTLVSSGAVLGFLEARSRLWHKLFGVILVGFAIRAVLS